jgi:predicted TIM-barrel fold metal-dependent hydrolase
VADYRLFQKRLGLGRNVIATPRPYLTDNRVTMDAIAQFAPNARGAATVDPAITDAELEVLHKGGIRAVRFGLGADAVAMVTALQPLAKRVNDMGWHIDFGASGTQLVALQDLLLNFPGVLVFDHMGRIEQPMGVNHPGFAVMLKLLDKGRTYVKLSMAAGDSKDGPPTFADVTKVARGLRESRSRTNDLGKQLAASGRKRQAGRRGCLRPAVLNGRPTRRRAIASSSTIPAVLYGFCKILDSNWTIREGSLQRIIAELLCDCGVYCDSGGSAMSDHTIGRRTFIKGAGLATLATVGGAGNRSRGSSLEAQQQVPNSTGTERPKLKAPAHACDCHQHIYDAARFPPQQAWHGKQRDRVGLPVAAEANRHDAQHCYDTASLSHRQSRHTWRDCGIWRQCSRHCRRESVRDRRRAESFGPGRHPRAALFAIRQPLYCRGCHRRHGRAVVEANRGPGLGHVKISATGDVIVAHEEVWNRLPSRILFDHMGRIPSPAGLNHPAFGIIRRLIDKGRTWTLLSVGFDNSKEGTAAYPYLVEVGQAYVKAAPSG